MKTTLIKTAAILFASILALSVTSCSSDSATGPLDNTNQQEQNYSTLLGQIENIPVTELNEQEMDDLLYMREEEKLARDVYITMFSKWNQLTFNNISKSEQQHMDALKYLVNRYSLTDPVSTNEVGKFTNTKLQELYIQLVQQGDVSLIDALKVGSAIEEIDILDLYKAIDLTDNEDIKNIYSNLRKGSENHLRAFVKVLSKNGVTYVPQYLSQEQYDLIVN
ncbi:MAG: DUF2202 domain-containing protein [Candidatus Kapaibacteriota bacterium]